MIALEQYLTRIDTNHVRVIDKEFAHFIQALEPNHSVMALIGFVLSAQLGKGHVCLDFSQPHEYLNHDELNGMLEAAKQSQAVFHVNQQVELTDYQATPLVLDEQRLYLQKYWQYEKLLEVGLNDKQQRKGWNLLAYKSFIHDLFEITDSSAEINWQAVAACIAANNKLSVISGGPGTGKTTTVIRLLALLIKLYTDEQHTQPIMKLVAPTGKAAMRLTESISSAKQGLDVDLTIKQLIPEQASTIHRLLKTSGRGGFQHNQWNPLHLDVLVVDEASMVDLPLMAKLLQALPSHAQVILLGDKDQLASVEAGSVLADICDSDVEHGYSKGAVTELNALLGFEFSDHIENNGASLRDHICHLRKSYRFHEKSGIGFLAQAANTGDVGQWQTVCDAQYPDLTLINLDEQGFHQFVQQGVAFYNQYISAIHQWAHGAGLTDAQALEAHKNFGQYQILCALREGPLGVSGLNQAIEQGLQIQTDATGKPRWYLGRPVIIMQNDYGLNLYNGDIGLLLPKQDEDGRVNLKAAFVGADQSIRWLQPSRLPSHETVFAMTVHKSQGSEFEHCALVLPDYDTQVLSKELIYTGITRAKGHLTCISESSVLQQALKRKVQRASGLRERLWQHSAKELKQNASTPSGGDGQFSLF